MPTSTPSIRPALIAARNTPPAARALLEPAVGAVFALLWVAADAARHLQQPEWFVLVAAFGATIALSRALPWASFALMCVIPVAQTVGILPPPDDTSWPLYLALCIAAGFLALNAGTRLRWITAAAGVPVIALAALLVYLAGWTGWTDMLTMAAEIGLYTVAILAVCGWAVFVSCWLAGFAVRLALRNATADILLDEATLQVATTAAELDVNRERERVAQEVHDVLAHSLAVVIAQADGARLDAVPGRAAEDTAAFTAIADAARSALVDVRGLVESLRDESESAPAPSIAELPALASQVTDAGLAVTVDAFGDERPLTPARQLAVYRIVQESLTNALRHGDRARGARVVFDWRGDGLALSVHSWRIAAADEADVATTDGGAYAGATGTTATGNGIRGMAERARLAGGSLHAGPVEDDGYLVSAFIPDGSPAPDAPLLAAGRMLAS